MCNASSIGVSPCSKSPNMVIHCIQYTLSYCYIHMYMRVYSLEGFTCYCSFSKELNVCIIHVNERCRRKKEASKQGNNKAMHVREICRRTEERSKQGIQTTKQSMLERYAEGRKKEASKAIQTTKQCSCLGWDLNL